MLRSDELANEAHVERDQKFRGNVAKGVAAAGTLATAGASGALASRVMPFLNQYIPSGLAIKGIEKVSPKLGSFLKKGQEMGLNVEEGLSFIKDKLGEKPSEPAKESRSILEQYSPELHQFVEGEIQKGRTPIQAAALAQNDKKFMEVIKKITKDHKTPWSAIIESVFGKGDEGKRVEALKGFNQKKKQSLQEREMERFNQAYGQQQQGQQSPSQGMQQQAGQPGQEQQGASPAKQQLLQAMQQLSQQLRQ